MPLINVDFKQIEMACFAQLSDDRALINLINAGVDLHYYTGELVLNKPKEQITDEERGDIKKVNFGLIYGNGPKTASENTGRSVQWCKSFIDGFFNSFPRTKEWHNEILEQVNNNGFIKMFDGILLKFNKYPAKYDWQNPNQLYYNPPEIKNYPVQHFAFVIFSLFLSKFYREKALFKRNKYLLINAVHDSIMLDCKQEYVDEAMQDIKEIVDKLPEYMIKYYQLKLVVPIKVDIKVGNSWYEV